MIIFKLDKSKQMRFVQTIPYDNNAIVCPNSCNINKKDFIIQNIIQTTDVCKTIRKLKPNITVTSSFNHRNNDFNSKLIFLNHGLYSAKNLEDAHHSKTKFPNINDYDCFIVASKQCREMIKRLGVPDKKIIHGICPQFDLIKPYDHKPYKLDYKKNILFIGNPEFSGGKISEEDDNFFNIMREVIIICNKNNFYCVIKSKLDIEKILKILKKINNKKSAEYLKIMGMALNKNNIFISGRNDPIYPYIYSCDIAVIHGQSSVEIEVCMYKKPLVMACYNTSNFGSVEHNMAIKNITINSLDSDINKALLHNYTDANLNKMLNELNILNGNHGKMALDTINKFL